MSSILKALKKLEDETQKQEHPHFPDTKEVVRKKIPARQGHTKMLWGSTAVLFLLAGTWMIFGPDSYFSRNPVPESPGVSAQSQNSAPALNRSAQKNRTAPAGISDTDAQEADPEVSAAWVPASAPAGISDTDAQEDAAAKQKSAVLLSRQSAPAKRENTGSGEKVPEKQGEKTALSPDRGAVSEKNGEASDSFREMIKNRPLPRAENQTRENPFQKPAFPAEGAEKTSGNHPPDDFIAHIQKKAERNAGNMRADSKNIPVPLLPAPANPVKREVAPSAPENKTVPSSAAAVSASGTKVSKAASSQNKVEKKAAHSPEPVRKSTDAYDSLPEKTSGESGLEIQALVWSEEPEGRMAVINGSIVRQSGMVADAAVSVIGIDFIIFRNSSGQWKQKFRLN
ncbi:MAG: hypothetical protein V2I97_14095 [Desulfococcaceae bacterium]|nr:hypothetical protein [Desulfococcaceae bacterium]